MPRADRRRNRDTGRRVRGFTLIEIVVALAIAALALVGLFRAGSSGVAAVGMAAQAEEATERAQSRLAEAGRLAPLAAGDSEGEDSDGYKWHTSVQALSTLPVGPAAAGRSVTLFAVEVTVSWSAGEGRRSVVLRSLRLG